MAVGLPIEPSELLVALVGRASEDPPPVSVTKAEYLGALDRLQPLLSIPEDQRETCWRRFAWIRSGYDQAVRGLAGITMAPRGGLRLTVKDRRSARGTTGRVRGRIRALLDLPN